MEADIIQSMSDAVYALLQVKTLLYLGLGVIIGTLLAVIPGVGGLMGLSLLLPFTFSMAANDALVFLIASLAVMSTADSIPAILFGVPGTPTSMATVLDGYPMAKRGEAGRAMGAAFTSSVLGGIIGALLLLIIIPVSSPVLMGATSPELLGFCVLGLAMVGALAGGSMAKGVGAALIGVLLAFIGQDANTATLRWTFGTIYLWDGLHILVIALGIYALPELADLAILRKSIAADGKASNLKGVGRGFRDTLANLWPVTRSATASSALGVIPAIGPTVIPWLIYSYTSMVSKEPKNFGQGDVRGVIACESSNNATVGGALLPTVALGVPGSAPMALFLGALLLHGIAPGPNMLTTNLDLTYLMVWAVVLANILGGILALALARPLSLVVFVRPAILVPIISLVVFAGGLQSTRQWEDGLFLLLIGALGWIMKRARWPRAPLFLAFILAPLIEKYFFISYIHGMDFVYRPWVAVLLVATLLFLLFVALGRLVKSRREGKKIERVRLHVSMNLDSVFSLMLTLIFAAALVSALQWQFMAGIMPQVAAGIGLLTSTVALLTSFVQVDYKADTKAAEAQHFDLETDFGDLAPQIILTRGLHYLLLLIALGILSWAIGLLLALPIFMAGYLLINRERPLLTLLVTAGFWLVAWLLFDKLLKLAWPAPLFDVTGWLGF